MLSEWISCKERLPKDDKEVVCLFDDGHAEVCCIDAERDSFFCDRYQYIWWGYDGWYEPKYITHWLPLPELPKEIKHDRQNLLDGQPSA